MQTAAAIDTHSFIKQLERAGFTEPQAEAQSDAINQVLIDFQQKRLEFFA